MQRRLQETYGASGVLLFERGRNGLELALRAFASLRPDRCEVIYPAYICPGIVETIFECGLVPVAADIGDDLNLDPADLRQCLSAKTLAVVCAHMYGAPARIAEIERICRSENAYLVDDAAQVAGIEVDGRLLGTFGDCGMLSFSQSKTVVAGSGGALIVNNPDIWDVLNSTYQALPSSRFGLRDLMIFLRDVHWQAQFQNASYYFSKIVGAFWQSEDAPLRWRPRKISTGHAALALRQFVSMPARVAGRRRVISMFHDRLGSYASMRMVQYAPDRYMTRVMVLLPPHISAEAFRNVMHRRGIQTRRAYPMHVGNLDTYPGVRVIFNRLVELPSHSRMNDDAVEDVCRVAIAAAGELGG